MKSNKWITLLIIIFVGYSLLKYKLNIQSNPINEEHEQKENHEIIDTINKYASILNSDPQDRTLRSKNDPIIKPELNQGINPDINNLNPVANVKVEDNYSPPKPQFINKDTIEDKLYNVIYNVLKTKQGSDLLEKILLTPRNQIKEKEKEKEEPNPYHNNSIIDILKGEGEPAKCGDIVSVNYIIRLINGQEVENTNILNKPVTFKLGNRDVIRGLEYAIIGMKKDSIRRIVVPPNLAYREKFSKGLVGENQFVTIDVELIDLKQQEENLDKKIRIFSSFSDNAGRQFLCSEIINFHYKIITDNDELLYSSQKEPVNFILGSSEVPEAINIAFTGIRLGEKRTIILPSKLLARKKISFLPKGAKIPSNTTIIFEVDTNIK